MFSAGCVRGTDVPNTSEISESVGCSGDVGRRHRRARAALAAGTTFGVGHVQQRS